MRIFDPPLTYLITSGRLAPDATPGDAEFARAVEHVRRATRAGVRLIQLREKQITARTLYELALICARITRGTRTSLLVNDRADVARLAGADGVHLTSRSMPPRDVRALFGADFLIGVSAHDLTEARAAQDGEADFATFSPIYATESKARLGLPPVGLAALREAALALASFPLVALGGITRERARDAFRAGAVGVAGISLFDAEQDLSSVVKTIEEAYERRHAETD